MAKRTMGDGTHPPSKRTVGAAIRISVIAASTPGFLVHYGWADVPDGSKDAFDLAFAARLASRDLEDAAGYAAGARLLREGWRP